MAAKKLNCIAAAVVAFLLVGDSAIAQRRVVVKEQGLPKIWTEAPRQRKEVAEEIARLDAMAKLRERIYGLEVYGDVVVYDLVKLDKTIDTRLNGLLKGMREEKTHYYDDGSCQLEMAVTLREVVERVAKTITKTKKKHRRYFRVEEFILRNTETRDTKIVVWGSGAIEGSAGVEVIQAQRAAELAVYEKLAQRIMGVQIDRNTTVRDMALASDEIRATVAATLKGVQFTAYRVKPKAVEADGQIEIPVLVSRIYRTYKRNEKKIGKARIRLNVESVERTIERTEKKLFRETGTGVRAPRRHDVVRTLRRQAEDPFEVEKKIIERIIKQEIVVE